MEVKRLVYDEPGMPETGEETLVLNFFMDCRDAMGTFSGGVRFFFSLDCRDAKKLCRCSAGARVAN